MDLRATAPGTLVAEYDTGPITRQMLARYAEASGDLNPLHWAPPYARASGFRGAILHGFSTMARAMEGIIRHMYAGAAIRLGGVDVRFTRPLVLPARVGLYVRGREASREVFVGDAPGGPAYLAGTFWEATA